MRKLAQSQLGWGAAALLAGIMVASGFQGAEEKTGIVDMQKMIENSEPGKKMKTTFDQMVAARNDLLEFINLNRVLTVEQAQKLKELSLKTNATEAEKAEVTRIKADVVASEKRFKELQTKAATDADRQLLQDFSNRAAVMTQTLERWNNDFNVEMQNWLAKERPSVYDKAKKALQDTAKAQGFSVVLDAQVAPFGANDLTDASTKALNAQK
ncbi:MAG: hypothetical protein HONBIEJF_02223 [Fimbriimonadaceae bacterium]|nr:hypothetical protein [Fimbriimonadaceae bacterium]